jgi:hypothetical protein
MAGSNTVSSVGDISADELGELMGAGELASDAPFVAAGMSIEDTDDLGDDDDGGDFEDDLDEDED